MVPVGFTPGCWQPLLLVKAVGNYISSVECPVPAAKRGRSGETPRVVGMWPLAVAKDPSLLSFRCRVSSVGKSSPRAALPQGVSQQLLGMEVDVLQFPRAVFSIVGAPIEVSTRPLFWTASVMGIWSWLFRFPFRAMSTTRTMCYFGPATHLNRFA